MKKFVITLIAVLFAAITFTNTVEAKPQTNTAIKKPEAVKAQVTKTTDSGVNIDTIGFHKCTELAPELQIKKIFMDYEKYTNNKDLDNFIKLHDVNYRSADGYNLERLKQIAIESWRDYPNLKYSVKVLSVNIDIDNATVITSEKLSGITEAGIDYVKGKGDIDSESTAIYYLQRFSNDWKIVSDFIINEKTYMRFGVAKYIPMHLDAPAIASANEDYTAIIKMVIPRDYVALVSLTNEPITYPIEKSTEVFRGMKADGIRERILKANDGSKNENAVASIAIAQPNIKQDLIDINIAGIAFLSTRVNVVKHKIDFKDMLTSTHGAIDSTSKESSNK